MKTWLVLAVLIASIFQAVPKQADKPQPNQNDSKHLAEQPPKHAMSGTENAPTARPSSTKQEDSANSKPEKAKWCERVISPVISNWPLIAVAVWGILVARSTLHAIRWQAEETAKATQAMRDSIPLQKKTADAALLNAQALMVAERAHVDVELILGDEKSCFFCASNHGRSVAYIGIYLFAHHRHPFIPNKGLPEDWREHNYSMERRVIHRMLAVGKRVTLKQFTLSLSEAERSGKDQAIYRGAVTYSDSFGEYETELVYRYDPPGKFTNLPQYNRYEQKQSQEKAN